MQFRIAIRPQIALVILFHVTAISCLIHQLELKNDHRVAVQLSSFGFLENGIMQVNVHNFTIFTKPEKKSHDEEKPTIGLLLIRSDTPRGIPFLEAIENTRRCPFYDNVPIPGALMSMTLQTDEEKVKLNCADLKKQPYIEPLRSVVDDTNNNIFKRAIESNVPHLAETQNQYSNHTDNMSKVSAQATERQNSSSKVNKIEEIPKIESEPELKRTHNKSPLFNAECPTRYLPLMVHKHLSLDSYSFNFSMRINSPEQQGLYILILYNCQGGIQRPFNHDKLITSFDLNITIHEMNYPHNYLSAGIIPLPQMYFMFSVIFFITSAVWMNFLQGQKHSVVKIHHLMTVLILTKSLTLLFHAINYHYISLRGSPDVIWAYLFYATRTMKGALFFITLVLIGSGWSFLKHMLSDKDKKIILFIVPMQILAHIAEIIIDETSEGAPSNNFWIQICGIVDLFCCVAILYPISWSIRHLFEASRTDGK